MCILNMSPRPKRMIKPPLILKEYSVTSEYEEEEETLSVQATIAKEKKSISLLSKNSLFSCKKCNIEYKSRGELNSHLRKHKGRENFLCEDCGKSLSSFQAFSEHVNIHKNLKPYKCDVCGHESRQLSVHSRHVITHQQCPTNIYKCTICSKSFRQREYLKRHMRKHMGEKPYGCSLCSKRFTAKTELNRHTFSHSTIRTHTCEHCGKKFKLKHNLKAHMKSHVGIQLWKCRLCKVGFPQQSLMEAHKKSHKELIQHLELVKTNERTITITSFPLDRRKVPHHQIVRLPNKINLNDLHSLSNSKISLGINDVYIPLSMVANSFGTGSFIKMKIIDQFPNSKEPTSKGVVEAVLIDEEAELQESKIAQDEIQPPIDVINKDQNLEAKSIENKEEYAHNNQGTPDPSLPINEFHMHCKSLETTFNLDSFDDKEMAWLQNLVAITRKLNPPLHSTICSQLHLVISKLQKFLIKDINPEQKRRIEEIEQPHYAPPEKSSSNPSSLPAIHAHGSSIKSENSSTSKFNIIPKEGSPRESINNKVFDRSGALENSEKNTNLFESTKSVHKCYLALLQILHKHFRQIFGH